MKLVGDKSAIIRQTVADMSAKPTEPTEPTKPTEPTEPTDTCLGRTVDVRGKGEYKFTHRIPAGPVCR